MMIRIYQDTITTDVFSYVGDKEIETTYPRLKLLTVIRGFNVVTTMSNEDRLINWRKWKTKNMPSEAQKIKALRYDKIQ